jgi:run domain Beclin-1 interacting cysteine-rich containing protein
MSLESNQIKFLRFCNYIGKYFCVSCHQNSLSSIPAYIILRWNFKRLPVSNFARDTLANIEHEPLFNVESLNPKLYAMVPELKKVKELRKQLTIMRKYITTCRDPEGLTDQYNSELGQLTKGDVHIYSLDNFSQIRTGLLLRQLRTLAADSSKHIKSCSFCQGKGFVCELCQNESDIIFPFDQDKVNQCTECHSCFHKKCYVGIKQCPKCVRRKERQQKRVQTVLMTNLEMD